jgi:hypothetical protein
MTVTETVDFMAGSTGFEPATSGLTGLEGPRNRATVADEVEPETWREIRQHIPWLLAERNRVRRAGWFN